MEKSKKEHSFQYEHYDSLASLPEADQRVALAARAACDTAYARYSGFRVGSAALLDDGTVVTGSNQESGVFPAGVCAERSLLYYYQAHYPDRKIVSLAIASLPDERECYPCGICRQVITDTETRQESPIRVIMTGRDSATVVARARLLLPFIFEL